METYTVDTITSYAYLRFLETFLPPVTATTELTIQKFLIWEQTEISNHISGTDIEDMLYTICVALLPVPPPAQAHWRRYAIMHISQVVLFKL